MLAARMQRFKEVKERALTPRCVPDVICVFLPHAAAAGEHQRLREAPDMSNTTLQKIPSLCASFSLFFVYLSLTLLVCVCMISAACSFDSRCFIARSCSRFPLFALRIFFDDLQAHFASQV